MQIELSDDSSIDIASVGGARLRDGLAGIRSGFDLLGRDRRLATTFLLEFQHREIERLLRLASIGELVRAIGALVHELQRERGASSLYLSSRGAQFGPELATQVERMAAPERAVEAMFQAVDPVAYAPRFVDAVGQAADDLARLPGMRIRIRDLSVATADCVRFFGGVIANLLAIVRETAEISTSPQIARVLIALFNLSQGKEYAGQERATGAAGFGAGRFDTGQHCRFLVLAAEQERVFEAFLTHATPEQATMWDRQMDTRIAADMTRARRLVRDSGTTGALDGFTGPQWFDLATRRIEAMRRVEERLAGDLLTACRDSLAAAKAAFEGRRRLPGLTAWLTRRRLRRRTRRQAAMVDALRRLAGGGARDAVSVQAVRLLRGLAAPADSLTAQEREEDRQRLRRHQEMAETIHAFSLSTDGALASIGQAVDIVNERAADLLGIAADTDRHLAEVAAISHDSAAGIPTVVTAAAELSQAIAGISRQAEETLGIAAESRREAEHARAIAAGLSGAARRIGEVVDLIGQVARQTNLLALNATVEAARAGEAGRGFAVVASEVKALSEQTTRATQEIEQQIRGVQSASGEVVGVVGTIGDAIARMSGMITEIAPALEQQDAATRRITASIQQVADGARSVDGTVGTVSAMAGDTRRMAETMASAADRLRDEASTLGRHVTGFIAKASPG